MKDKGIKLLSGRTKRYCRICKTITVYDYNKLTGHSYCSQCGDYTKSNIEYCEEIKQIKVDRTKEPYRLKLMKRMGF